MLPVCRYRMRELWKDNQSHETAQTVKRRDERLFQQVSLVWKAAFHCRFFNGCQENMILESNADDGPSVAHLTALNIKTSR